MDVYKRIASVSAAMAKEGISKARNNQQQGYKFRGIDDVYNALAPILAQNELVILPRVLAREVTERQTAKGGVLFYVTVEVEFDFVAASDDSKHTIKTFGEAMDSADKATNKAMSAAYKYACMQAFCIPTEGDNDADAHTHEIAARTTSAPAQPVGLKASEVDDIKIAMHECGDLDALKAMWAAAFKKATPAQRNILQPEYEKQRDYLTERKAA